MVLRAASDAFAAILISTIRKSTLTDYKYTIFRRDKQMRRGATLHTKKGSNRKIAPFYAFKIRVVYIDRICSTLIFDLFIGLSSLMALVKGTSTRSSFTMPTITLRCSSSSASMAATPMRLAMMRS